MANETTKVVLDLDNKEFVSKLREALGLLGELGKTESLEALSQSFLAIGAVAGVVGAAVLAIKTAIDWTEEAEKIKQVSAAFDNLAKSAGLSADVIKKELLKAVDGLADDTKVIESASKLMTTMGQDAEHLGEVMQLARKYTALFGGDLIQNFEGLGKAIEFGNQRMLRTYGIIIDVDKAQKDYAKTLGVGVQYLTDAEKRHAAFNAALTQGAKNFKDVDENALKTQNSIKRIGTAFEEMKEAAILAWDKVAGTKVASMIAWLAEKMHGVAVDVKAFFGDQEAQRERDIAAIKDQIKYEEALLARKKEGGILNKVLAAMDFSSADDRQKNIDKLKTQLKSLEDEAEKAEHKSRRTGGGTTRERPDRTKLIEDQRKFEAELLRIKEDSIRNREQVEEDAAKMIDLINEEIVVQHSQAENKILEIHKKRADGVIKTDEDMSIAIQDIREKEAAKIIELERKKEEASIQAARNREERERYTAAGVAAGWNLSAQQAANDAKNFSKLGQTAFTQFKSHAVDAFKAIGTGSKTAGEIAKGFMFGSIGAIAEAWGETILGAGIGTFNPVQIAEGGALIALGEYLKSQGSSSGGGSDSGGAGGGGGGGSGGGGGGIPGLTGLGTDAGAPGGGPPLMKPEERKSVNINIQGHYFETEQTRTRMMDMIRESGDFTDFDLKKIGQN